MVVTRGKEEGSIKVKGVKYMAVGEDLTLDAGHNAIYRRYILELYT